MRLRSKIVLILSAVIAVFATATLAIQRWVIMPGFAELEQVGAERDVARITEALANEIAHLDSFCFDWAAWDDTYTFVADGNQAYRDANLPPEIFETGNFTLLYYFDLTGHLVWGENRDPEREFAMLELESLPARDWSLEHPLFANHDPASGISGVYTTESGPMLVSARPILQSDKQGAIRGWLVMGRKLTSALAVELSEQTHVEFALATIDSAELQPEQRDAARKLVAGAALVVQPRDAHWLDVHECIDDYLGHPALLVSARIPREVTARGAAVLDFALISTLLVATLLLVVLLALIQTSVVSPVTRLTEHAVALGQSDDLSARCELARDDEIGVLARAFDAMVAKLAESRAQLVDSARRGGMSEVATSVLHNVGNVLNSVNVSSVVVGETLASSSLRDLERAIDLMSQHQADLGAFITQDARGVHLPEFLRGTVRNLCDERAQLVAETENLQSGIGHIRALVDAQQDLARQGGAAERVDLVEKLERALKMASAGLDLRGIEIVREFAELPPVRIERHKLLQILVNLIRNAAQATQLSSSAHKRVTLALEAGAGTFRIRVRDTGVGIAPENLTRIFSHGFTTKHDGHGFGLHSCANAATELGGSLTVESPGLGRGATFVLELPLESAPVLEHA